MASCKFVVVAALSLLALASCVVGTSEQRGDASLGIDIPPSLDQELPVADAGDASIDGAPPDAPQRDSSADGMPPDGTSDSRLGDSRLVDTTRDAVQLDALVDTRPLDSTADTTPPTSCTAVVGGFCWYLGKLGESCTQTCQQQRRAYDPATQTYAGALATDTACTQVANALGVAGNASWNNFTALGCSYNPSANRLFRYTGGSCHHANSNPDCSGSENLTHSPVRRICACR